MTRAQEEMPLAVAWRRFRRGRRCRSRQEVSLAPRSFGYVALLVALGSFGPLTMSIYTPVMPSVGASLGAGADSVKLTLTTYMLGFAVGQLFYGPLSDRFGRRPVLLGGLIFFTVATFACSFASSIGGLIGLRILQGLGAASGSVIGRAMTRDAYTFQEMPLVMSWISLGQNIAPSLAPTLGGFLGEWASWRATFWFVGGFGTLLLAITLFGLPETNRHRSDRLHLGSLLRGSGEMLRDRQFLGNVLTLGFAFAINFGMLAGVPFILQDHLGFSPQEFGLIVLLSVGGFTAGTFVNNRLVGRVRADRHDARLGLVPRRGSRDHGRTFALRHRHLVGDHRPARRAELRHRPDRGQRQRRRGRHVSQARRHGLVAGRAGADGHGRLGHRRRWPS